LDFRLDVGNRLSTIFITALAPLAWGTTYLVTTEFLPANRPFLAGMLRALPAGIVLALVSRQRPVGSWWWKAAVLGVLNIGGFFALLFTAAYRLPGGVAASVGAIQPLVAAGLAVFLLREPLRRVTAIASGIAVIGVVLLTLRSNAALDSFGILAALGGAVSMATGVVFTKYWVRPVPLLAFTSWQLIAGGLFLVPFVVVAEGLPDSFTARNIGGYVWLGSIGCAVAYSLWFRGIALLPVASTSLLGALSPLNAAVLGWLVVDQRLSIVQVGGIVLIVIGVVIAQLPSRSPNDGSQVTTSGSHR
jgi:probable blue pigment (indigoidine) exporter